MKTFGPRGALACAATLAALALTGCSTDRYVDLNALYAEGEPWELTTNARDTTEDLCVAAMPACVQALSTDQAHYLKYDSAREAEDAMSVAGPVDVRRTESILVEYIDPSLTEDERTQILDSVAGAHVSDS